MSALSNSIQINYYNYEPIALPALDNDPNSVSAIPSEKREATSGTEELKDIELLASQTAHLKGRVKKGHYKWSRKEDQALLNYVNLYGQDFHRISEIIQNRSIQACRSRFYKLQDEERIDIAIDPEKKLRPSEIRAIKRRPLTPEEREIFSLMKIAGAKMPEISMYLKRSVSFCKAELKRIRWQQGETSMSSLPLHPFNFFYPATRAMENSARAIRYTPDFYQPGEGLESEKLFLSQDL